jgi:hypothetical protein
MKKPTLILPSNMIDPVQKSFSLNPKRMLAYQIEHEMAQQQISRVEMAARMKTSRMQLNRLLDADNPSVTLQSIETAASVLGLQVIISLKPKE